MGAMTELETDAERDALIALVKAHLARMHWTKRADFLRDLAGNYCRACGDVTYGQRCHCENDE